MADRSGIEWTEATWNPVTGCSKVSPGCAHCHAETLSLRFRWCAKPWLPAHAKENVILHPERLEQPLRRRSTRLQIHEFARPGKLVKDLVAGSGIRFEDRGLHSLKSVGEWHLFKVVSTSSVENG